LLAGRTGEELEYIFLGGEGKNFETENREKFAKEGKMKGGRV
jgi:hypothetical protein